MKKKKDPPSVGNTLRLFSKRLDSFKGESRRSYQKAFSSLQLYLIRNYNHLDNFDEAVVENWILSNLIQGLSLKTVSFYLDKIAGLYSAVAHKFIGGKTSLFKIIKQKLKKSPPRPSISIIEAYTSELKQLRNFDFKKNPCHILITTLTDYNNYSYYASYKESVRFLWGCLALKSGIRPGVIKTMVTPVPEKLKFLDFTEAVPLLPQQRKDFFFKGISALQDGGPQWFAMRLRPKVKYDDLLERLSKCPATMNRPELFYPSEEIAKRIGRKMVWKGKPVIHDVVFFKYLKCEIYPLFTQIYDLAWCYRTPGSTPGNYASIPDKAMDNFKNSLGLLTSDCELTPIGEMDLKPGDEIVILDDAYMAEHGEILKKASVDAWGNKIYRVSLLSGNSRWDIGVDARLLKKP